MEEDSSYFYLCSMLIFPMRLTVFSMSRMKEASFSTFLAHLTRSLYTGQEVTMRV